MRRFASLKNYMVASTLATVFVAVIVFYGTRLVEPTLIAALATFIFSIVTVATLDLSFKPDDEDPNKPKLR